MKTTVIHHSADYDGIFCREIACKFLPDAEFIGWDFADAPLPIPSEGQIYVLDLPLDRPFGKRFIAVADSEIETPLDRYVWIDHHKSAIKSHPPHIPGYRIDGVAACRLAWQWFMCQQAWSQEHDRLVRQLETLPEKQAFLDRKVSEPLAVRLAGEYDVWDHRDNDADIAFQFGLDAQENLDWQALLNPDKRYLPASLGVYEIIENGRAAMRCYAKRDSDIIRTRSFKVQWHGLTFLCLNTARCNSNTFAALDVPETGHDALLGFYFNGKAWSVSMYHAKHRKDIDLSEIAKLHGGGGHRGACGFASITTPAFLALVKEK